MPRCATTTTCGRRCVLPITTPRRPCAVPVRNRTQLKLRVVFRVVLIYTTYITYICSFSERNNLAHLVHATRRAGSYNSTSAAAAATAQGHSHPLCAHARWRLLIRCCFVDIFFAAVDAASTVLQCVFFEFRINYKNMLAS